MPRFLCPVCKAGIDLSDDHTVKEYNCIQCGQLCKVPGIETPPGSVSSSGGGPNIQYERQQTDIFAVLCFATAVAGVLLGFPIIFAPAAFIFAIVSRYRLKDNPYLKGRGLRIVGAIINIINILYLMNSFGSLE